MLIDCGEAAQIQMLRYGVKPSRIDYIFISHLHPDHILCLPGLLSSQSLVGRKANIKIYAPPGLQEILETQFNLSGTYISYNIAYFELKEGCNQLVMEDEGMCVTSFSVKHRIPCWGFVFKEKKAPRKINKEAVTGKNFPTEAYEILRSGHDYTDKNGHVYRVDEYTLPSPPPSSYAYITDTLYLPELAREIGKVDILYHEATYAHDLLDKAINTFHSTAVQAAEFAKIAGANKLIIGHFSSRYKDLSNLLEEARSIFPETDLAEEGKSFTS